MKIKNLTAELCLYRGNVRVAFLSTLFSFRSCFYGEHSCHHSLQEMSYDIYVVLSLFSNQIWVR